MRAAVISDIHSNLPALKAVLKDWEGWQIDQVWCLGDIVGYGADPWACWKIIADLGALIVKGNHEEALDNQREFELFNDRAQAGIIHARQELEKSGQPSPCLALPLRIDLEEFGVSLVHGTFNHPEKYDYVIDDYDAFYQLAYCLPYPIGFVGHTHRPFFASVPADQPAFLTDWLTNISEGKGLDSQEIFLDKNKKYLINPGSVGQPRDYDPRAGYGILEVAEGKKIFSFRRVPYDVEAAGGRIKEAGLPESLADRLHRGN